MRAPGSLKLTVPGPLTWLHVVVSTGGIGSPSSMAAPVKVAMPGSVITWSRPAFTTGARLIPGSGGGGSNCACAEGRSEERRVGKECRARGAEDDEKRE